MKDVHTIIQVCPVLYSLIMTGRDHPALVATVTLQIGHPMALADFGKCELLSRGVVSLIDALKFWNTCSS